MTKKKGTREHGDRGRRHFKRENAPERGNVSGQVRTWIRAQQGKGEEK